MKNGKIRFCYEIGDAPCRACDIGDTIDYFLEEDISTTIEAVPVVRCKDCIYKEEHPSPYWKYWCNRLKCGCDDDWFCADGEKK